jgi:hypothetical protein
VRCSYSYRGERAAPLLAFTVGAMWTATGLAQAWLPSAHETSAGVAYTDTFDTKHVTSAGQEIDAGHICYYTYTFAAAYSPTDRIMLNASVPLIRSVYHGAYPHPTTTDDGSYHSTFTDLRVEAHYQLMLHPIAIAPYVAYSFPTHSYSIMGHAAPGRGLDETWLGAAIGISLDRWIPNSFLTSRFTYAVVEHVQGISHDKENIEASAGYYLTPYLSVEGLYQWQRTIGGLQFPGPPSETSPLFPYHDQLAATDFTNAGLGASWSYSDSSTFSAAYLEGLTGRNGHKLGREFSIAYSYGFFGFRPR